MAIVVSNHPPVDDYAGNSDCSEKFVAFQIVVRCHVEIGFRINSERIILSAIKLFRLFIVLFCVSFITYILIAAGHPELVVEIIQQFILLFASLTKKGWL